MRKPRGRGKADMGERWNRQAPGRYRRGPEMIVKVDGVWVRGVRCRSLAEARDVTPGRIYIDADTAVDWDAVVRQREPALVPAVRKKKAFVVQTAWGETLRAKAGDWLLGAGSDRWPVGSKEFAATYTRVRKGHYVKTGWALMKRMAYDFAVQSPEGWVDGSAGDHLMEGPLGDRWRIAADKYPTKGYVPLHELPEGALPSAVPPPTLPR